LYIAFFGSQTSVSSRRLSTVAACCGERMLVRAVLSIDAAVKWPKSQSPGSRVCPP
jgi:hypothetical protein